MKIPLKLLLVEDSQDDADLIVKQLKKSGYEPEWKRIQTETEFLAEIKTPPDVILCDYSMPRFSGLRAAQLLQESGQPIPFLLISGTVGEEAAVEAMRLGATDYLLKDRIARLGSAVERALEQAHLRRQRIHDEAELRRTHDALRQMVAYSPVVIYELHVAGHKIVPVRVSENIERLFGYTMEESLGSTWWTDCLHPDDMARVLSGIVKILDEGNSCTEYRLRHKNGSYRWIEDSNKVICDAEGSPERIVGAFVDITERKQSEIVLRESEEKFRQIAENINEVFWATVPGKREMLYVSPAYERIWGRPCSELYIAPSLWLDALHPDDRARISAAAMTKQEHGEYNEIYRIIRPDGELRWIHDRAFPVRNADGNVYRIVGTAEDITNKKNLEDDKKRLEDQFLRAQRLENIGMLAGGIAHDLNNVLAPIVMSCDLLAAEVKSERAANLVEMIEGSAERGVDLVKQVLSFARGMEGQRLSVQPQHLVREMVSIIRQTFPKSIRVHSFLPRNIWFLSADPTQIHQVLLNLCVNARDAMPSGGELTLSAENVHLDDSLQRGPSDAKLGKYVVIKVKDSGTGIAPEIRQKIFDPFFTTKEAGLGTGLGLSTSLGIVKSHGGYLEVDTEVGKGTTIEVWFPAAPDQSTTPAPTDEVHYVRGHGERILVADDEAAVRTLTKQTLEAYGYTVLTASNGAEAVAVYARHKDEIEAVITDVVMPVMDGLALVRALMVIKPSVRVLASSGSPDREMQAKLIEAGVKRFIQKPYTVEMVITSLDDVLRGP